MVGVQGVVEVQEVVEVQGWWGPGGGGDQGVVEVQ